MKSFVLLMVVLMSGASAFGSYGYDNEWKRNLNLVCLQRGNTPEYCTCMAKVMMSSFSRENLETESAKTIKSAEFYAMGFEVKRKCGTN